MKTVIVGAGALGSLFAFLLHRAGAEVTLIERDAAIVKAIGGSGLRVEGVSGSEIVPVPILAAPTGKGTPDLVVSLVKCHEAASAGVTIKSLLGPRTVVATLQNGVGNETILAAELGAERIVGGTTNIGATLLAPGHVLHTSWGDTSVAALDPNSADRAAMVASFFSRHGIKTQTSESLESLLWGRVLIKVGVGAVTALTRIRNGKVIELEPARQLMRAAVGEGQEIVKRAGIKLPYFNAVTQVEQMLGHTAENLSAMQQDIYRGRRSEVEAINGAVVKLAETLDLEAPINRTLLLLIQTVEAAK
jgi:2-dehydropantoate 2-reductase